VGKYDKVKVGDQFERPKLHARGLEVAMVTHIWDDPVEQKTYVGMAHIRRDGSVDRPTMKHTKRGIGTNRWKPASRDWLGEGGSRRQHHRPEQSAEIAMEL
jgi:hypothetical protein